MNEDAQTLQVVLTSTTCDKDEELYALEPLRDLLAFVCAAFRGSHTKLLSLFNKAQEVVSSENEEDDFAKKEEHILTVNPSVFIRLTKFMIPGQDRTYKMICEENTKYLENMRKLYNQQQVPVGVVPPPKDMTITFPNTENLAFDLLTMYRGRYRNSKMKGVEHLQRFHEVFGLGQYYIYVDDANTVILPKVDLGSFMEDTDANKARTVTIPEPIVVFSTYLENFPRGTTPHWCLHHALTVYYRVSLTETHCFF